MTFDAVEANALSNRLRGAVESRLATSERILFEGFLQQLLGVKNIRNVQLWTRAGIQQRQFLRPGLGDRELDLRTWIANLFSTDMILDFPKKTKSFLLPIDGQRGKQFLSYYDDPTTNQLAVALRVVGTFLFLDYAVDSDDVIEYPDLDSDEFDDVLED